MTVGNLIVLPSLGKEEDEQALEQVNAYYPNYTIEQLNISDLVKDGGGINCVSWCRYANEQETRYLKLYNSLDYEDDSTKNRMFTDEEIIFMCKHNIRKFAEKFPGIAEYYIKCLDD